MEDQETGLGLDKIFGNSSPSPESDKGSASPKTDKVVEIEKAHSEIKAAEEPEAESAAEKKPEEKADAGTVKVKVEEKPTEEKEAEAAPKIDWDSEENPWKKRQTDTHDWSRRLSSENAEMKRQLEIVNAKLDGTYDPEMDKAPELTTERIQAEAEIRGKIKASESLAYELHGGKEKVEAELKKFNDNFGTNQFVQNRVLNSDAPIMEALKILKELAIVEKYGTSDPEKIIEAVKKEAEKELRSQIAEEENQKIMARLDKKEKLIPSLTDVRGTDKEDGKRQVQQTPLNQLFSN